MKIRINVSALTSWFSNLIFDWRESLGCHALDLALRILPRGGSPRTGIVRGLAEQRAYDRYTGYTMLCGGCPVPFYQWRELWQTMQVPKRGYPILGRPRTQAVS